ncbi:MAG: helix-turn-helix transcriptional regulator [Leadbetterella sp.]|nr:helix-turn-helix transcriptional regulator [Leadbetterella sp.]
MTEQKYPGADCKKQLMAVHDAMDILSGKWKIYIVASLCYHHKRRFSDISNDINGISNKMLSKELKDLEMNRLVERTVLDTQPITVEYALTDYGRELQTMIKNLADWGMKHRRKIIG